MAGFLEKEYCASCWQETMVQILIRSETLTTIVGRGDFMVAEYECNKCGDTMNVSIAKEKYDG